MAKLNEYLGGLISSVTDARVLSDMQTLKVAKEYAKNNLLKHFSVPRMRIDEVEMTIPIALDKIDERKLKEFQSIDMVKFNSTAYEGIISSLGLTKLPVEFSKSVRSEIENKSQTLEKNIKEAGNLEPFRLLLKDLAIHSIRIAEKYSLIESDLRKKITPELIEGNLEKLLINEIKSVDQKNIIADLDVIVEAHKLKEQKPENIIQIKLKVSEDSMMWDWSENKDGEIVSKLLPD